MARFKLFPRYRRPSLGELLGISQAERQVSRKYHLRIVRDPSVVGHRGAVGFAVQVTFFRPDTEDRADRIDLSARAEATVRQAAADWSAWLVQQLAS
jgi:hypothetical protein